MQQFRSFSHTDEMKATEKSSKQPITAAEALAANASSQVAAASPCSPHSETSATSGKESFATLSEENKTPRSPARASVYNVAQAVSATTASARPFVVIPAGKKRKKTTQADSTGRHLTVRFRQTLLLVTILIVSGFTLVTLIPLSAGQNGFSFFSNLSTFLPSSRGDLQVQAHQTQTAAVSQIPPMILSHSQYVAIAEQDATNVGISPTYFVRQIQQESGFNPNAVSPSGAVGIAQFLPSTAAGLGINPWDPVQALQGAAKMMANSYHQYGDYAKALAAYNAGSANLNRAVQSCGAQWLSCMPAETQNYIAIIMG